METSSSSTPLSAIQDPCSTPPDSAVHPITQKRIWNLNLKIQHLLVTVKAEFLLTNPPCVLATSVACTSPAPFCSNHDNCLSAACGQTRLGAWACRKKQVLMTGSELQLLGGFSHHLPSCQKSAWCCFSDAARKNACFVICE